MSNRMFITGCDEKTSWQLPWFVENFKKHNPKEQLIIYNFGMKNNPFPEMTYNLTPKYSTGLKGWSNKPSAMIDANLHRDYVCWLDTDVEVRAPLGAIFDYVEPNKLAMVEDKPWTTRRKERWHNSGVVAFKGIPTILTKWANLVQKTPNMGDQEVLHSVLRVSPLTRLSHITDLPNKYNVLRLQIQDDTLPDEIYCMHWTGRKGNDTIKEQMTSADLRA